MTISYCKWESYIWKNELATQSDRVALHFAEALSDDDSLKHNPYHMLDRAIVLSGFAIRRMVEKRLVTDRLANEEISVRIFPSRQNGDFRHPYIGYAGESAFRNYDFEQLRFQGLKIGDVANEIIHASQIMVSHREEKVQDGLLIASDCRLKDRLLHFTIEEFSSLVRRALDDFVRFESEQWDPETGKVSATRE
jgi:hypothetical protein